MRQVIRRLPQTLQGMDSTARPSFTRTHAAARTQQHHEGSSVSDEAAKDEGTTRSRLKPGERLPWGRFWWKEWVGDPAIRRLTRDQRGALADVRAFTYGTATPGVMTEEDVRAWAGYSPEEWKQVRAVFARVFKTRRGSKTWRLPDIIEDYAASLAVYNRRRGVAMKGVAGRRRRKDLATEGATTGAPQVTPEVTPAVDPGLNPRSTEIQKLELEPDSTDKPEADSEAAADARAQTTRSRAGSAGTAGSSRPSVLAPIVERALRGATPLRSERGSA